MTIEDILEVLRQTRARYRAYEETNGMLRIETPEVEGDYCPVTWAYYVKTGVTLRLTDVGRAAFHLGLLCDDTGRIIAAADDREAHTFKHFDDYRKKRLLRAELRQILGLSE